MPTICMLAEHPDVEESDVRAVQAIISNWFENRYGTTPEFLDILDYFDVKGGDSVDGEPNE